VWENVVETDRPQMQRRRMRIAYWISKATNTHYISYLLLFTVCTNAPQCSVTRTWPVLFEHGEEPPSPQSSEFCLAVVWTEQYCSSSTVHLINKYHSNTKAAARGTLEIQDFSILRFADWQMVLMFRKNLVPSPSVQVLGLIFLIWEQLRESSLILVFGDYTRNFDVQVTVHRVKFL